MKKIFLDAISWSKKWYFSSFSGAMGTCLVFKNLVGSTVRDSILYSLMFIPFTIFCRIIWQYVRKVDFYIKALEKQNTKIELLQAGNSKIKSLKGWDFYGEAMIVLRESIVAFNYLGESEKPDKDDITISLFELCDNLKFLFENRFQGHVYAVSVKVFSQKNAGQQISHLTEVETICRDKISLLERSRPPVKVDNHKRPRHDIGSNSCFLEFFYNIVDHGKNFFLSNCLPCEPRYRNSNFISYGQSLGDVESTEERRKYWKLPYKSELVVPIIPRQIEKDVDIEKQFIGYLCVNCKEENGFHQKYDPEMMKNISDALYKILKNYHNI